MMHGPIHIKLFLYLVINRTDDSYGERKSTTHILVKNNSIWQSADGTKHNMSTRRMSCIHLIKLFFIWDGKGSDNFFFLPLNCAGENELTVTDDNESQKQDSQLPHCDPRQSSETENRISPSQPGEQINGHCASKRLHRGPGACTRKGKFRRCNKSV